MKCIYCGEHIDGYNYKKEKYYCIHCNKTFTEEEYEKWYNSVHTKKE